MPLRVPQPAKVFSLSSDESQWRFRFEAFALDPKVIAEQPALSCDSRGGDAGADYLRRIREDAALQTGRSQSGIDPHVACDPVHRGGKERRRSPRFRCAGSAELRVEGTDVRTWGTLSDVSLHGCYVEMNNTLPVDTRVHLVLEVMGVRALMHAVVRVSYPFLGMGLCFLKVEPQQLVQLERLLAAVSKSVSPADTASTPASASTSTHSLADVDREVMLDALTEFFRANSLLSREEFYQIARRARR